MSYFQIPFPNMGNMWTCVFIMDSIQSFHDQQHAHLQRLVQRWGHGSHIQCLPQCGYFLLHWSSAANILDTEGIRQGQGQRDWILDWLLDQVLCAPLHPSHWSLCYHHWLPCHTSQVFCNWPCI